MSSYKESEIKNVAVTIIDEFGEINTTELKDELRKRMRPSGSDLVILKNRADDSFSQKVRNLVSHLESSKSIANFVDVDTSVKPTIFRSRRILNLLSSLNDDEKKAIISHRKAISRAFVGKIVDFERYQAEKSEIGSKGELFILSVEKENVESNLGIDVAKEIVHSSVTEGDGLGYDILSYDNNGIRHVEVKTTKNGVDTPFYMTYNEKMFIELHVDTYWLYRVYNFDATTGRGDYIIIDGRTLLNDFKFSTQSYRVKRK